MVRVKRDRRIMGKALRSFTSLEFRAPKARFHYDGACLTRIFATLLLYIIRARERVSLSSPKCLISFNLRNNTMICRLAIRSRLYNVIENFSSNFQSSGKVARTNCFFFDVTAVSAGFQLNGLLAKRG